jgi:coenzyme F420 hydrogenase subunit beta
MHDAITFKETKNGYLFPEILTSSCIKCGQCLRVCPGIHFEQSLLEKMDSIDPFIGNVIDVSSGRAADEKIFTNGQSGGLTTAILLYLLRKKEIDGAFVVTMQGGLNPRPMGMLIDSEEQLSVSQKSKYAPVNLLAELKKIKDKKRLALVGLSCHIHGLANLIDNYKDLRHIEFLKVGLFCDRTMLSVGIDYLVDIAKCKSTFKNLHFRDKICGGYPGNVHVFSDNFKKELHAKERMLIKDALTPKRCKLCFDKLNVFADISIGDAWGVKNKNEEGESACIVRTVRGKEIVDNLINEKNVLMHNCSIKEIIEGQGIVLKKKQWKHNYDNWYKESGMKLNFAMKIVIENPIVSKKKSLTLGFVETAIISHFNKRVIIAYLKMKRIKMHILLAIRNFIRK